MDCGLIRKQPCPPSPTVYLSGACSPALLSHAYRADLGLLIQPATRYATFASRFGGGFALDNGCFSSARPFDEGRWFRWLSSMPRDCCRFAVAPDVVADAAVTWRGSEPWLEAIRTLGFPAALVFQNGIEDSTIAWNRFGAAFIGGTTAFKCSPTAVQLMADARARDKAVHVGRVNSLRRLAFSADAGADSVDGTFLAYGPRTNLPRLLGWLDHLARFSPAC